MEELKTTPEMENNPKTIMNLIDSAYVDVPDTLRASNEKAAKAEFLENPNLVHPNNEYGFLDAEKIQQNLASLDQAQELLQSSDMGWREKLLISLTLEDSRKKNDLLAAVLAYNNAVTDEDKEKAKAIYKELNESLYGKPDEDTFYSILNQKLAKIDVEHLSKEDKEIYDQLMEELGPLKTPDVEPFRPKPETIQQFADYVDYFYEDFLKYIPTPEEKEKISSEELVDIINKILQQEFGGGEVGFKAVIDPKAANASVTFDNYEIKFPENKSYSNEKARQLLLHELGTHAMRAIPYLSLGMKTLVSGLPGYSDIDEGIAKYMEYAVTRKYEDAGLNHYINIGLATFKHKNFREVYEIRKKMQHLIHDKEYEEDESKLFADVQRCFRGTGELVLNKDMTYFNGQNEVGMNIEEGLQRRRYVLEDLLLWGKINNMDSRHLTIIYELKTGWKPFANEKI